MAKLSKVPQITEASRPGLSDFKTHAVSTILLKEGKREGEKEGGKREERKRAKGKKICSE